MTASGKLWLSQQEELLQSFHVLGEIQDQHIATKSKELLTFFSVETDNNIVMLARILGHI